MRWYPDERSPERGFGARAALNLEPKHVMTMARMRETFPLVSMEEPPERVTATLRGPSSTAAVRCGRRATLSARTKTVDGQQVPSQQTHARQQSESAK